MDSVTQIALGTAVSVAVMRNRVPVWQAALWGAFAGTAPDLDVVVDFGDGIANMVRHRAETHAIAFLTLGAPVFAAGAALLGRRRDLFKHWLLAFWLVFMTHILIDYLTVYGTQLLLPFSDYPFGRGSIFIIDPLYTLPLLGGLIACLVSRSPKRWRWNAIGIGFSSLYLVWGLVVQQHVTQIARDSLPTGVDSDAPLLVTPAPLNSVLWRLIAVTPQHYHEGWYSLLDPKPVVQWRTYDRGEKLIAQHAEHPGVKEISRFSHGFFKMHENNGNVFITDLRMGSEPAYFFDFNLGPVAKSGELEPDRVAVKEGARPELDIALPWLVQRIQGRILTPLGG